MNKRIKELKEEISKLEKQLKYEQLLQEIWLELGPYTNHLSRDLRHKLQDHFGFDDSE
jgi:hypothetical protein